VIAGAEWWPPVAAALQRRLVILGGRTEIAIEFPFPRYLADPASGIFEGLGVRIPTADSPVYSPLVLAPAPPQSEIPT
jgi:hypothetical protein